MEESKIVSNMPLVYHTIHKYYPTYSKDEDIVQSGMLGLVKAASSYNPKKGKFSTYAVVAIKNEIVNELNRREKDKILISMEDLGI